MLDIEVLRRALKNRCFVHIAMASLDVSAATLYYETVGSGPVLLCIAGALGSVEPFRGLAEILKDHFTVALYDRKQTADHSLLRDSQELSGV